MDTTVLAPDRKAAPIVLVIDDNPDDREIYLRSLKMVTQVAYKCLEAQEGIKGMEIIDSAAPDCVLLDYSLPGHNGLEILKQVRARYAFLPIILLTGQGNEAVAVEAIKNGASNYLVKSPMSSNVLHGLIQEAINHGKWKRELAEKNDKIEKQNEDLSIRANFDTLTSLPNRTLFENRLGMALARMGRTRDGFGVVVLDLNHFKDVNDTYGHAAGDMLLKQVAECLAQSVRSYDTAARIGGDEFALLIEGAGHARDCVVVAQNIIEAVSVVPFMKDHKTTDMGVSIGITLCNPNSTYTKEQLIEEADQAMYQAKLTPQSNFRFYNSEIHRQASERLNLESDLRNALSEDELELYYQPIFDLLSNKIVGVEALTRWNRSPHGFIAPANFMRIAEESNLAPALDKWVLTRACRNMKEWQEKGLPAMQVGINLSQVQLDDPAFPEWAHTLLAHYKIESSRLAMEVPASAMLDHTEKRMRTLTQLKTFGISIHLDHFGDSPVSLSAMQGMPLDALKIAPAIVQTLGVNENTPPLIHTIIMIAHRLNLNVIAVGVERGYHELCLKEANCDSVQGFGFVSPMSNAVFQEWRAVWQD